MNENDIRIGHKGDALGLLEEMIAHTENTVPDSPAGLLANYFKPRIAALKDALEREII